MFCQKCGAYNTEDSKNCGSCGAVIEGQKADAVSTQAAASSAVPVTKPQAAQQPKYVAAGNKPNFSAQPVKEYLVQAILVTLLCNSIFGAVALVFSVLTSAALKSGERIKAEVYSQKTKLFCWIGLWVGLAAIILVFLWVFFLMLSIGMAAGAGHGYRSFY